MSIVLIETPAEGIARVVLNRPEKRNAINPELRAGLREAFERVLADGAVRAIVVAGAGGHFCAGGDIDSMQGLDARSARARMKDNHRLIRLVLEAEKPVIAAIEGFAVGAGAGLALLADTVVMAEGATMGFPFFRVGLMPDYGLFFTLPRRVGWGRARQILLYARMYKTADALALGLADEQVKAGEANRQALALATELAAMPPHAFALAKRQLALAPIALEEALEFESMGQALSFNTTEFAEGRAAFQEKRAPKFR